MINYRLVQILQQILNRGLNSGDHNWKFKCPFCNHSKYKLQICVDEQSQNYGKFHCWVCNTKGTNLHFLLHQLKIGMHHSIYKKIEAVYKPIKDFNKIYFNTQKKQIRQNIVSLPLKYKPLYPINYTSQFHQRALNYLLNRGLTINDIIRYNIGFCTDGQYSDRIIIPSYSNSGILNYFVSRSIGDNNGFKYKNPSVSKNIIFNQYMVDFTQPIILVQGVFDAIAIRRNVIPLLGKQVQSILLQKLKFYKPKVYICLDSDAENQAYRIGQMLLQNDIDCKLINMNDKDPAQMGYDTITEQIMKSEHTSDLDFVQMFKYKLSNRNKNTKKTIRGI